MTRWLLPLDVAALLLTCVLASGTLNAPARAADGEQPTGIKEINFDDIKLDLKKDEAFEKATI